MVGKKKSLTPEKAAKLIGDLIADGLSRDKNHAIEQHPDLEIGAHLLDAEGKPLSRGSGAVAPTRPDW